MCQDVFCHRSGVFNIYVIIGSVTYRTRVLIHRDEGQDLRAAGAVRQGGQRSEHAV